MACSHRRRDGRPRCSNEAETRQDFGESDGARSTCIDDPPRRCSQVDDEDRGTALVKLRSEIQPATTVTPCEMQSPLVEGGGEIREGTKRDTSAKKDLPVHEHANAGQLEPEVLLRAVRQQIAEENARCELDPLEPMAGRAGEVTRCPLSSVCPLTVLVSREPPLGLPDGWSELKCESGIVTVEIDETEPGGELGTFSEELADVVLAVTGPTVQREKLPLFATRPRRHGLRRTRRRSCPRQARWALKLVVPSRRAS